jgi:hypothetical protein
MMQRGHESIVAYRSGETTFVVEFPLKDDSWTEEQKQDPRVWCDPQMSAGERTRFDEAKELWRNGHQDACVEVLRNAFGNAGLVWVWATHSMLNAPQHGDEWDGPPKNV